MYAITIFRNHNFYVAAGNSTGNVNIANLGCAL